MSTRYRSGLKAQRQNETRRVRNKSEMSRIRTQLKKTRLAIESGDQERAQTELLALFSALDKGAKHGRLHKNAVARRKSRMAKALADLAKS